MAAEDHKHQHATAAPPRRLRRVLIIALAVAIAAALIGILQRRSHDAAVAKWTLEQAVPVVATISPTPGAANQQLSLPGTVQAWYEAPIFARVNGYIKNWYFDYGAHVKKGDLLAEIDAPDLDAQLAAAQGKLNSALALVKVREAERQFTETTYERWRNSPTGVVSVQEQESKQADYNSAVARLTSATADAAADKGDVDRLQALAGFKKILAPFDGIVTARETDIGALINAGSGTSNGPELFRVADVHQMRIYVQVPQQLSAGIAPGLAAELHLPQYPDKRFKATVATTSSAINLAARTLLVELHADNPDDQLQPGAYARVSFELPAQPNVLRLPTSTLIFRERGMEVATIGANNEVVIKPVTLGRNLGTEVEIVNGLNAADRVVISPPDSLAAGDFVHLAGESSDHVGQANTLPANDLAERK
jgi:RND family efflux transporter MFP subunit